MKKRARRTSQSRVSRIPEQILLGAKALGWSYADFAQKHSARTKTRIHRTLLHKKLTGITPLPTREAEDLADTLRENGVDITLVWPQTKSAA